MARVFVFALFFAGFLSAQVLPQLPPPPPAPEYPDPPEEDTSLSTAREYVFNPLQAKKEIDTGNFYWKKGNHKAAAMRYREATLWDDSNPEAFYKLGQAYEKLEQYEEARTAWESFLKLSGDKGKNEDVRKAMAKFPPTAASGPAVQRTTN